MIKSIEEELFPSRESFNIQTIASNLIKREQIKELMQCVFSDNQKLSDRALWAMSHCNDLEPQNIKPYYEKLILKLSDASLTDAYKRNVLHLFSENNIPKKQETFLLDKCYSYLHNSSEAIAIRALSIPIIYQLSLPYPELLNELKLMLLHILSQENPPALHAKARIVLKQMDKLNKKGK